MTPKFLREEAARFRGMADTADREASKLRFLAMATDFEARAKSAEERESDLSEAIEIKSDKKTAKEPKAGV